MALDERIRQLPLARDDRAPVQLELGAARAAVAERLTFAHELPKAFRELIHRHEDRVALPAPLRSAARRLLAVRTAEPRSLGEVEGTDTVGTVDETNELLVTL